MPLNKAFEIRLSILDKLFISKKRYNSTQMRQALNEELEYRGYNGISRRQFFLDLDEIRNRISYDGVTLNYDIKKGGYYYDNPDYSLSGIPVSKKDKEILTVALTMLQSVQGVKNTKGLNELIERLCDKIGIDQEKVSQSIYPDHVPNLKGVEHIYDLLMKTIEEKELLVRYTPFGEQTKVIVIQPAFMKEYNNRWYIIGYVPQKERPLNLAIDRINFFEETGNYIDREMKPDHEDWSSDIIGVTKTAASKQRLIFRFQKPRAFYVMTKPFHRSQKTLKETNTYIDIQIEVIPNKELEALILSFGNDVKQLN